MNMIEKVARAIAPKAWDNLKTGHGSSAQISRRTASLRHARAAIAAMREPGEAALIAGAKAEESAFDGCGVGVEPLLAFEIGWKATIDAMMAEKDGE
jgi:hypothetical protein